VWLTAKGKPLEFSNRKYLKQIYTDQAPEIVYMKSSQMGLSERSISEAVWLAEQKGRTVLYVFPAQKQLQEFVQARVNPVLGLSDYLADKVENVEGKKVGTLGLKRIGKGYVYFRGSHNEKQIITIDADVVYMDERNRFLEENVPFIEKRLLASDLKWKREISTPTLPNKGVHASYLASDQRVWQIQCNKCGKWQELDFFKHVDFKTKKVRCTKCKKTLNRLADGRWKVTNPKSKIHGYKINGLYNPMVTIEAIIKKYKKAQKEGFSTLQQFFNQDLGLPYEVSGQRVRIGELDACKRDYYIPIVRKEDTYAGVDVGVKYIHVVVVQKIGEDAMRVLYAGTVRKFEGPYDSLESIINKYKIKIMVIDKKPEVMKVREMINKFPGRVYAAEYPPNMRFPLEDYIKWDDIKYEVKLDRTMSLDYLIGDIQNQRIELPQNIESVEGFYEQIRAAVRVMDKRDTPKWVEEGPDHYLHALNLARAAQLRGITGQALLDYYREPDEGLTPSFIDWLRINARHLKV